MLEHRLSEGNAAQEQRDLQAQEKDFRLGKQMEKWSGWRRGAQHDWVEAATKVEAAVVEAAEVRTTVEIAALHVAAMAAKKYMCG